MPLDECFLNRRGELMDVYRPHNEGSSGDKRKFSQVPKPWDSLLSKETLRLLTLHDAG